MIIETLTHNGKDIQIVLDESAEDPRKEWDHLGTFFGFHRNYMSPDAPPHADPQEARHIAESAANICIPVWLYDHSGTAYRAAESNPFHCPWDSGLFGFIYVSKAKARNVYGVKRLTAATVAKVREALESEVAEYSAWANGEVYGWKLLDRDGEEIDACYGYYGDVDRAKQDACEAAE